MGDLRENRSWATPIQATMLPDCSNELIAGFSSLQFRQPDERYPKIVVAVRLSLQIELGLP